MSFHFLIRFTKQDRARFLSHRELMTLMERAVRRAAIPVSMSEGFNPRPRIAFPTALALGISSADEVISIQLAEWMSPGEINRRLAPQLTPGISLTKVEPLRTKSAGQVTQEQYQIVFDPNAKLPSAEQLKNLMAQAEVIITRQKFTGKNEAPRIKKINIRPYLQSLELAANSSEEKHPALKITLKITPQGTARPEEILTALGYQGSLKKNTWSVHKLSSRTNQ